MNFKSTLRALVLLAMLWQSAGTAAAALMGCCAQGQACCVVANNQHACSTCAPVAAPLPLRTVERMSPVRTQPPCHTASPLAEGMVRNIWRPPMAVASGQANSIHFNFA